MPFGFFFFLSFGQTSSNFYRPFDIRPNLTSFFCSVLFGPFSFCTLLFSLWFAVYGSPPVQYELYDPNLMIICILLRNSFNNIGIGEKNMVYFMSLPVVLCSYIHLLLYLCTSICPHVLLSLYPITLFPLFQFPHTVYPRFYPLPILSKFDFIHFSLLEILNKKLLKLRKMWQKLLFKLESSSIKHF